MWGQPLVLAFALLLEVADVPRRWRGHIVSRLVPPQIHPAALIYRAAARLAVKGRVLRNVAVVFLLTSLVALIFWAVQNYLGSGLWQAVLEAYLLKLAFSETHILYPCLWGYRGDECPREVVQQFVRRDLSSTSCPHVASACLESAAESFVDSFVSPLFWYALLGLPGAWIQRTANMLDGLMGFKEWGRSGAPAARLDTALNWAPARIAALFILASAYMAGSRPDLTALKDRRFIESINARWPISAMAAAIRVKLEKPGSYSVGSGRLPHKDDVGRGLAVLAVAATLYSTALLLSLYIIYI
ncbi:MAG: CobD/CbiB family cobalamin biosynthesis protein [Thermoproteus sp.]